MAIKAVLFDLDATLADRQASITRFCQPFLERYSPDLEALTAEGLFTAIQLADAGGYRSRDDMFAELVMTLPWRLTPTTAELASFWLASFPGCAVATTGVAALLDSLRSSGLPMGIVTNGRTAVQTAKIDTLELRLYMQTVVISEEAGVEKPNPVIFQHALSLLGVDASEALFVGDDPVRDIEGARNAGLHPVWFRASRTWPSDLQPSPRTIDSLRDLLAFI